MVHIPFDTRTVSYDDHFTQYGGGIANVGNELLSEPYTYYRGLPWQRGYGQRGAGIGSVLRILWRMLRPAVKTAGKAMANEALNTGSRIMEKVDQGTPLKEAVVGEGKKGIDNLLDKSGLPKQFGGRLPIKRRRKSRPLPLKHHTIISKPKRHRKRLDTFGLY